MNKKTGEGEIGAIIFMLAALVLLFGGLMWFLTTITKTENNMTCPKFSNFRINSIPARCAEYFNLTTKPNE